MTTNVNIHLDKDQNFEVEVKSSVIIDSFVFHVVKIKGTKGEFDLFLSVEQMVALKNELERGIEKAVEAEFDFQMMKSEDN